MDRVPVGKFVVGRKPRHAPGRSAGHSVGQFGPVVQEPEKSLKRRSIRIVRLFKLHPVRQVGEERLYVSRSRKCVVSPSLLHV